jgi:hypothetical protein
MGMMSNIAAKIKPALQQAQANKGSGFMGAARDAINQIKANPPTPAAKGSGFARAAANAIKANRPMKKGGSVSSASKRADGCCTKGKTKGRMI